MYAFQLLLVYLNVPTVTYRKTKEEHFPIDQQMGNLLLKPINKDTRPELNFAQSRK